MGPEARQNAFERARRAIGESLTRLAARSAGGTG